MELKLELREDHVHVRADGPYDPAEARRGMIQVVKACEASGLTRILVDGRGIPDPVPISDRYDLATLLASLGAGRLRMAIVVSPENMYTKTLEDTATNRGLNVRTTASLDEAMDYLELRR